MISKSYMKTLFKRDAKGNIRVWTISTLGSKIIQVSGLLNGKCVTNEKVAKSKNLGKANFTTPCEQAILEAESTYKSKLDEGYSSLEQLEKLAKEQKII